MQICSEVMTMTYYSRFLEQKINLAVRFQKILLLFGARQTGKTTLLRHLMEDQKVYFINLQDRRLRRRYETDPGLLLRELEAQAGANTVVIDEIQKVPQLLDEVPLDDGEPRPELRALRLQRPEGETGACESPWRQSGSL
jgi:predicted AAA+ superfamily ATPase